MLVGDQRYGALPSPTVPLLAKIIAINTHTKITILINMFLSFAHQLFTVCNENIHHLNLFFVKCFRFNFFVKIQLDVPLNNIFTYFNVFLFIKWHFQGANCIKFHENSKLPQKMIISLILKRWKFVIWIYKKKIMVYWVQPHIFSSSVVIKVKIQDNKNQNQILTLTTIPTGHHLVTSLRSFNWLTLHPQMSHLT